MLIAADRDGNWLLHAAVVEQLLPVFLEFDSTNYLRYALWYLEKIKVLQEENQYLFQKFVNGHFVIKSKPGKFNSISPDLKLEQTIQRTSKDSEGGGGSLVSRKKRRFLLLTYHETHLIENVIQELTHSHTISRVEYNIHHEIGNVLKCKMFNNMVTRLYNVVSTHGNIFLLNTSLEFRNILTKEIFSPEI